VVDVKRAAAVDFWGDHRNPLNHHSGVARASISEPTTVARALFKARGRQMKCTVMIALLLSIAALIAALFLVLFVEVCRTDRQLRKFMTRRIEALEALRCAALRSANDRERR
jgi:hypothetical protein